MHRQLFALAALFSIILAPAASHAAWPYNGLPVSVVAAAQFKPVAVPDGSGGVIIAWADRRALSVSGDNIYVQRLDKRGNPQWALNGLGVTAGIAGDQPYSTGGLDMVADGAGGAYLVWDDSRGANIEIYAQRIDANGASQWTSGGVLVPGVASDRDAPRIVSYGGGGVVVAWADNDPVFEAISAQRLDDTGTPQWAAGGVQLVNLPTSRFAGGISLASIGGPFWTLVAWQDNRSFSNEIFAQCLDTNGVPLWQAGGALISDDFVGDNTSPQIFHDGFGGAMVAWRRIDGGVYKPAVRRVAFDGTLPWSTVELANMDPNTPFKAASDGNGGAFVAWVSEQPGSDLFLQKVTVDGNVVFYNNINVTNSAEDALYIELISDSQGGVVATWHEFTALFRTDIYAQRISATGLSLWASAGAFITDTAEAPTPELVLGDDGAPVVVWDVSSGSGTGLPDIYAQRLDPRHGGWGHPEPTISSISDVPADQGGLVQVNWLASDHDVLGIAGVDYYSVWRAISGTPVSGPGGAAPRLVEPQEVGRDFDGAAYMAAGDFFFEWIGNQDAFQLPTYGYTVSTLNNSSAHYFQVIAHDFSEAFVSQPDSGMSVDNLAPAPPFMLTATRIGGDLVDLDWSPSGVGEPDLDNYVVYRGTTSGVPPTPVFFLSDTPDTSAIDSTATESGEFYYIVTARDINDNESTPTNEAMVGGTPTGIGDPVPAAASLRVRQNSPNPFSMATTFSIGLPSAASVSVEVFDVAGRRVAERDLGHFGPGWQQVGFEARDAAGKLLPSGVYFYRVKAGGEMQTRKMVIRR